MNNAATYLLTLLSEFKWLGNWLFFPIAFLECLPLIGYIFPGGTLLVAAGILAANGFLNPWAIFIFASSGAMLGDLFSYSLGRWGGDFARRRRLIKKENILKGEAVFAKYGSSSVFWSRFGGLTWATIPFISGSLRLNFARFFRWNLFGSLAWASTRVLLGYFSGNIIAVLIRKWSGKISFLVIVILLIIFLYWLIKKHQQNIWRNYVRLSAAFTSRLISFKSTQLLIKRYPIITEFFKTKIGQERLLAGFMFFATLIILYLLVIIFDLI